MSTKKMAPESKRKGGETTGRTDCRKAEGTERKWETRRFELALTVKRITILILSRVRSLRVWPFGFVLE